MINSDANPCYSCEGKSEGVTVKAATKEKADIKAKLEEARQRRLMMENSR